MKPTAQPTVAATLLVVVAPCLGLGCGTRPPPGLLDGSVANTTGVCQHTCTPDPGPPPMSAEECTSAEMGLEIMKPMIWDFESPDMRATSLYSYTDNTEPIESFIVTEGNQRTKVTWQPFTAVMSRCGEPGNHVVHVQGGPFLGWGGGVGTSFQYHTDLGGRVPSPATDVPPSALAIMMDVSGWDGISFWARRGPDSQSGFRVAVGDKNTDDDVSYLMHRDAPDMPRFCERVKECSCLNHMPCKEATDLATIPPECAPMTTGQAATGRMFCGPPMALVSGEVQSVVGSYVQCNTCAQTRCDERYPAYPDDGVPGKPQSDVQFVNRPCTAHNYRNGVASEFCYDPSKGETVAEPDEQCGDHWTKTVALSNEWRFFTVPFTSMIQQGWAKKFAALDLAAVTVMRFTWDGGWIDYYIDDVSFYRRKK